MAASTPSPTNAAIKPFHSFVSSDSGLLKNISIASYNVATTHTHNTCSILLDDILNYSTKSHLDNNRSVAVRYLVSQGKVLSQQNRK
jgi:hypothetical protein